MVDETDAVSSETDENEATTQEVVETTENPVAQAKPEADDADQGDNPGDEAEDAKAKAEDKDDEANKSDDDKKPNRTSAKERISQLNQKWRDEQRESARLRSQLDRLRKAERPDPGKYDDQDEYSSDLAAYKIEQRQAASIEESAKDADQSAMRTLAEAHSERAMDFAAETPDFHAVAENPALRITPEMAHEIMDSDFGPQVQYYLGKNPREADRISRLAPNAQIRAIGQLEARVSTPTQKRVTQAPAPIKPIGEGRSSARKTPDTMSVPELAKYLSGN